MRTREWSRDTWRHPTRRCKCLTRTIVRSCEICTSLRHAESTNVEKVDSSKILFNKMRPKWLHHNNVTYTNNNERVKQCDVIPQTTQHLSCTSNENTTTKNRGYFLDFSSMQEPWVRLITGDYVRRSNNDHKNNDHNNKIWNNIHDCIWRNRKFNAHKRQKTLNNKD